MSIQKTTYTDEFKTQIVSLYNNGKPAIEILNEYKISSSTLNTWVNNFNKTQSFKAKDNRSEDKNELIKLKKENQQLRMENDILKQAALIMGRKSQ